MRGGQKEASGSRPPTRRAPRHDDVELHPWLFRLRHGGLGQVTCSLETCLPRVQMPPRAAVTRSQRCTSRFLHEPPSVYDGEASHGL